LFLCGGEFWCVCVWHDEDEVWGWNWKRSQLNWDMYLGLWWGISM
jgi:hypothetical protein